MVALLVAVTSLVDWLGETFDEPDPPPPPRIDASVQRVALRDRAVSLGDYARLIGESTRGVPAADLAETGLVFDVRVRLRGGLDETFPLRWTLHEATTGDRLRGAFYNQPPTTSFTPRSRDHSRTWPIWVPYPPRPGRYFLRATLIDQKRQPVDERDSAPVALTEIPG